MPSAISLVTLLTDFGERDYFVPSLKGVILGINTQTRIIDISHAVQPHSISEAFYFLQSTYHYFPDGTIHVVVVDPGVGSDRQPLLVTTTRHFFLAPDNGVLSPIFNNEADVEVRAMENKQYRLDSEGATFEGRDVFAPAAGWLTRGQTPGSFGRLIRDFVTFPAVEPQIRQHVLTGQVMYIDQFGNVISNITPSHLHMLREVTKRQDHALHVGGQTIAELKTHYAQDSSTQPKALINSIGYVEVFVQEGHAAQQLGIHVGDLIEVK